MLNSKVNKITQSWVLSTVKGNQEKQYLADGTWLKQDYFPQESISEVLISQFLEASGEDNFVRYWLGDLPNQSYSYSFTNNELGYLSFVKMLELLGVDLDKWLARRYYKATITERFQLVKDVYMRFGVSEEAFDYEMSRMLKLDFLMMNIDRHLKNFGVLVNYDTKDVMIAPIFDNGLSLGVGIDNVSGFAMVKKALKNTVKVKPFSRIPKRNLSVAPYDYYFNFDVVKFLEIHDYRIDLSYTAFIVFLERLCQLLVVDCRGRDLRSTFVEAFGDWTYILKN